MQVSLGPKTFEMPDFSGENYLRAETELKKLGAQPTVVREYNDTMVEDFVIRTDPAAGETVEATTLSPSTSARESRFSKPRSPCWSA